MNNVDSTSLLQMKGWLLSNVLQYKCAVDEVSGAGATKASSFAQDGCIKNIQH